MNRLQNQGRRLRGSFHQYDVEKRESFPVIRSEKLSLGDTREDTFT